MASMATATASAAQHVPYLPMGHIPRIRPPRIPKGTPNANTNPQPAGKVPHNAVWAQGKWRNPASNAVKDRQKVESRRVEKAIRHETHGQNVYAYANIRTNQVVYSLTRIMQNNKIISQLVYHGKKTVPAALRRDMWTPYFSIHFPRNEHGSMSGLFAYHQLRELSLQRQLSPPKDLITARSEDVEGLRKKYDPLELEQKEKDEEIKFPTVGQLLPKNLRAKRLMDQKATSVADLAFVLGLQAERPSAEEQARLRKEKREKRFADLSKGAKKRLRGRASLMRALETRVEERAMRAKEVREGSVGLAPYTAKTIGIELQEPLVGHKRPKVVSTDSAGEAVTLSSGAKTTADHVFEDAPSSAVTDLDEPEASASTSPDQTSTLETPAVVPEVRVLWADIRDATFAQDWPETVVHAKLEPKAVLTQAKPELLQQKDEDTPPVSVRATSIHVIGAQEGKGHYKHPREVKEEWKRRKQRVAAETADGGVSSEDATAAGAGAVEESEQQQRLSPSEMREETATALKEQGIEVETPRIGLWERIKGLFRR